VISRSPEGVPIYERYFLGGINTIRGLPPLLAGAEISPLSEQNPDAFQQPFTFGANWQLVLNSEIEFLIIPAVQIKGVIFFDAGNGYNLEKRYCSSATANANLPDVFNPCQFYPTFQNLRYSVGFGFRWFLAHRTPALRVGHPAQQADRRGLDRVRVHDWHFF